MCHRTGSSLIPAVAQFLSNAKLLPKRMLNWGQLDPYEQLQWNLNQNMIFIQENAIKVHCSHVAPYGINSSPHLPLNKMAILGNSTLWNLSEILIKTQNLLLTKMHLKISSVKWQPFCQGGDELISSQSNSVIQNGIVNVALCVTWSINV